MPALVHRASKTAQMLIWQCGKQPKHIALTSDGE
jgi:hypothetical protein